MIAERSGTMMMKHELIETAYELTGGIVADLTIERFGGL
jgi:hypothetical protein